jgi:rubredoxin
MTQSTRKFVCQICEHVYDEAEGDPASGLAPGTRWEDVPEDWSCPECGATKADFTELTVESLT